MNADPLGFGAPAVPLPASGSCYGSRHSCYASLSLAVAIRCVLVLRLLCFWACCCWLLPGPVAMPASREHGRARAGRDDPN